MIELQNVVFLFGAALNPHLQHNGFQRVDGRFEGQELLEEGNCLIGDWGKNDAEVAET